MDWIKKHYEKILLAGALLLLILVAAYLVFRINRLNEDIQNALRLPEPPNKPVSLVELAPYSNAIVTLQAPPQWTNPNVAMLFPPIPVKTAAPPVTVPVEIARPQIVLEGISRRPFQLQFKAYVWNAAANEGRNFQINFLTENRSFFVENVGSEIADRHGKTGYFITKFERKINLVRKPGINAPIEEDVSQLTVKQESEEPIVLTLGKLAVYPKRYARIRTPERTVELPLGGTFESGEKTYKVVDITDKEVIILELKSGEKQTLSLMPISQTPMAPVVVPREGIQEVPMSDVLRKREMMLK